jgi:hypothetical protein
MCIPKRRDDKDDVKSAFTSSCLHIMPPSLKRRLVRAPVMKVRVNSWQERHGNRRYIVLGEGRIAGVVDVLSSCKFGRYVAVEMGVFNCVSARGRL